ncbi:MAG: gliding motility-associated C-terminal domain-containing protein, partial [Bacteroidetes bacterium]
SVTLSSCKVDTVTANLNITSGIPPFNIIRTGVQLGSSQDDPPVSVAVLLNRGENNLIIVGGNGCRDTVTVQAVDPSGPAITNLTPVHATSCIPAASGSVSFHVNNNAAPYSYVLNNDTSEMNFTSPITIDELLPGMYSVFVIDSGECVSNAVSFEIMEAEKPQITLLVPMQADSCVPANSGEMQVAVSGPSRTPAGYQYSTDGGANFTAAFQTDNPFTIPGLAPGTYSIVVKDGGGCESEASEETIDAPEIPVINELNESDPSCADPASGSITVATVSPGNVADYQYSIDPPDKDDFGSSSTFANLQAMTYQIRARDEVGCVSEPKEAVLQIPNSPVASIVLPAEDRAVCQAGDAIELMGNPPGSGETASWQAVTSSSGNTATLDPASVQPGTVEVIYTITRDSDQCQGMASRTIEVLPQPEINESLEYADGQDPVTVKGTRYEVETGRPIVINVNASPASAMHQLSWEATGASQVLLPSPASGSIPFQGSLELDQAASGSIQFRLSDEASYTTNSVPANLSCSSEKTIDIDVTGEVVIPPILSPNGDGQNDVFRLSGIGNPQHFELRIYNRKGALVFQSNDIRTAWTGGNSPDGVYYYKATFNNEERTGAILLQRSVR